MYNTGSLNPFIDHPNRYQAPLTDLVPQDGAPCHRVRRGLHPPHLLHAGQLM